MSFLLHDKRVLQSAWKVERYLSHQGLKAPSNSIIQRTSQVRHLVSSGCPPQRWGSLGSRCSRGTERWSRDLGPFFIQGDVEERSWTNIHSNYRKCKRLANSFLDFHHRQNLCLGSCYSSLGLSFKPRALWGVASNGLVGVWFLIN